MCLIYILPSKELLEAMKQSRKEIFEVVKAVICDLPNSSPGTAVLSDSEHHFLSLSDIEPFVQGISAVIEVRVSDTFQPWASDQIIALSVSM